MNLQHRSNKLLIVGASGTGKTTFLARYLAAIRDATQFIYDHQGDIATRLGLVPIVDYDGLLAALRANARVICFDPADLYPADLLDGFNFFSDFTFIAASNFTGRKIFVCDEIQLVTSTDDGGLPSTFAAMLGTGRKQELDLALVSTAPNQCNTQIRNQATEVVAFNLALDSVTKSFLTQRGFDVEQIPNLAEGAYIARDTRRNLTHAGQLFKNAKKIVDSEPPPADTDPVKTAPPSEPVTEDG